MVDLSRSLRSVYTATLRKQGGSYFIDVPKQEIEHETIAPGEIYRVALLQREADTEPALDDESDSLESQPEESELPAPPVSEGETRQVTIESLGSQGDGIAKVERGYVVIVPDGEPGDEPTVRIERVKDNVAFATILDHDE